METPLLQWGYRVLEDDSDGDPLDHGVVSAVDFNQAKDLVQDHLNSLGIGGRLLETQDATETEVRFYPIPKVDTPGIHQPAGCTDVLMILLQPSDDGDGEMRCRSCGRPDASGLCDKCAKE